MILKNQLQALLLCQYVSAKYSQLYNTLIVLYYSYMCGYDRLWYQAGADIGSFEGSG